MNLTLYIQSIFGSLNVIDPWIDTSNHLWIIRKYLVLKNVIGKLHGEGNGDYEDKINDNQDYQDSNNNRESVASKIIKSVFCLM